MSWIKTIPYDEADARHHDVPLPEAAFDGGAYASL